MAILEDREVVGWGTGLNTQKTDIPTPPPYLPGTRIRVRSHRTYMKNSKILVNGNVLSNVVSLANGNYFSVALKSDGGLAGWGEVVPPAGLQDVNAITACSESAFALEKNGAIAWWPDNPARSDNGQIQRLGATTNVVAISADLANNTRRLYLLQQDGTVQVLGTEVVDHAEIPPDGLSNVISVAAGPAYCLALEKNGTVVGWGYNREGEATGVPSPEGKGSGLVNVGGQVLSNVVAISANWGKNMRPYSMALKKDGTVVGWGPSFPTPPPELTNVIAISAGDGFCLAITTNKKVADQLNRK